MVPYNTAIVPTSRALEPWRLRLAVALAALGILLAVAPEAPAQGSFQVTYQVDRSSATQVELVGRVYNGALVDAVDVYVTAEALNATGKVLARGIAFVASSIPARKAADFSARVPTVAGTTGFKVGVSSFRYGLGRGESP